MAGHVVLWWVGVADVVAEAGVGVVDESVAGGAGGDWAVVARSAGVDIRGRNVVVDAAMGLRGIEAAGVLRLAAATVVEPAGQS